MRALGINGTCDPAASPRRGAEIVGFRWGIMVCAAMALCSCVAPPHLAGIDSGRQLRQIELSAAGNEWVSFNLQLVGQPSGKLAVRLISLEKLGCDVRAYRREKIAGNSPSLGEALVPMNRDRDLIAVSHYAGPVWVDVHVPAKLAGSEYQATCELLQGPWVVDRLPIVLKVHYFTLPERATLPIVGEMTSTALKKLYSGRLPDSLGPLFECCRENRVELWFSDLLASPAATEERSAAASRNPRGEEMAIRTAGLDANLQGIRSIHWRDPAGVFPQSLPWFYPGNRFGQQQPVQSIWLKFMRQSEQDGEYLRLAEQRGQGDVAQKIARLMVHQRQRAFEPFQTPADEQTDKDRLGQGRQLLVELIEAYDPAHPASEEQKRQLKLNLAEWMAEHGRPMMLPRWTHWTWDPHTPGQLDLELGVDIFNPSDNQATRSTLRWSGTPVGWRNVDPPTVIPQMPAHQLTHAVLKNSFDATTFHVTTTGSMQAMVISGFDGASSALDAQLPVASCDRRTGSPIIDGSLTDWSTDDTAFNGNLIYSSPGNNGTIRKTASQAGVYTNFSSDALFVAFRLNQVASASAQCRLLIQTLHVTCAPNGQYQGPDGIRYAATLVDGIWRGELAIPWSVIGNKGMPTTLRFNFLRHDADGWSSVAGPVGGNENDAITGILVLRDGPGELVK